MYANQAYCELVGRPVAVLRGRSSVEWTHPEHHGAHARMAELEAAAEARGERPWVEKRYVRPNGEARRVWLTTARVTGPGGARWTAAYVHDITARRLAEDALRGAALSDPLTGLLNRRGWRERTDTLDAAAPAGTLVVAMLDLDHFKAFNDRLGHRAGDELLRVFGARVGAVLGPEVVVARWGGEEFALALPGNAADEAGEVLAAVAAVVPGGRTLSGGFTRRRVGESVADALDRADRLLYEAKAAGRDRLLTDHPGSPR